jgi:hypothetical protein
VPPEVHAALPIEPSRVREVGDPTVAWKLPLAGVLPPTAATVTRSLVVLPWAVAVVSTMGVALLTRLRLRPTSCTPDVA